MREVDTKVFLDQIVSVLEEGYEASIPVKGVSMEPLLKENRDFVFLKKTRSDYEYKSGDVLLFQRLDKSYVLHRVHRCDSDSLYMRGDNQKMVEKIDRTQVRAIAVSIKRNGKMIYPSNNLWTFFSGPYNQYVWIRQSVGWISNLKRRMNAKIA